MNLTLPFRVAQLRLLLNATPLANVWDNASSSPIGDLWLSLHSADPGETGTQLTNEIAYTPYARVAVIRNTTGWVVSDVTGICSPVVSIVYPILTVGSGTCTHVGIGRDVTGAGYLFASGTISPNIVISLGIAPELTTASTWAA